MAGYGTSWASPARGHAAAPFSWRWTGHCSRCRSFWNSSTPTAFVGLVAEPFAFFEKAGAFRGAECTIMVYTGATTAMAKRARAKSARAKHVRRSVTLPAKIARQVEVFARQRDLSANRMLVELIEQ